MTLIDRQAAINELSQRYIIMDNPHYIRYNAGLDEAQKVIKALPSVYVSDTNVGDMISRDAVTAAICKLCNDFDTDNPHIDAIIEILDNLPAVQTEIIHCKDCKFYGRADKRRFYRGSDCLNKRIDTIVPDRDFCSRAERGEAE